MLNIYYGSLLNPSQDQTAFFDADLALVVDQGVIIDTLPTEQAKQKYHDAKLHDYSDFIILPGLFDMHFHWVQDDVRSMPKDSLLDWLNNYTFPTESKFADAQFCNKKASEFFPRLLQAGTLGGAVYSSIHDEALEIALASAVGDFIAGNVTMTMDSPAALLQTKQEAIKQVEKFAKKFAQKYAFTPRFALATDPETMIKGGEIARKYHSFIQTHLSENTGEIEVAMGLIKQFEELSRAKNYTEIYDQCKLLGPKTLMAHCIHLSEDEWQLLADTNTVIVHCPTSNAPIKERGLGSGLFDFNKADQFGVRWVMGSDIGAGPFLSMFDVMQSFVSQNKRAGIKATYSKAFYHSTIAGAEVLGLKNVGSLATGQKANFLCVKKENDISSIARGEEVLAALCARYAHKRECYDSQLVSEVYINGIKQ